MAASPPLERESSTPIHSAAAGRRAGVAMTMVVLLLACLTPAPAVSAQRVGSITEARVSEGGLNRVTLGPDNKLWFTEGATSSIGRIAPRQLKRSRTPAVDHFPTPTPDSSPIDIVTGADGNLWFTEFAGNIGRITPSGEVTEFRVPGAPHLFGITAGPDGNLWFIANCCGDPNGMIGRITPSGRVRLFRVRRGTSPSVGITTGPDGRLWYTATNVPCDDPTRPCAERIRGTIQRMRPSGRITGVFRIPTPYSDPSRIVTGPDGNLWFTEQGAVGANGCCEPTHPAPGKIGRITPRGRITEFTTPTPFSNPAGITVGPDGNLWFTEYSYRTQEGTQQGGNKIGRITTRGVIKEFPLPTPFARADGITFGPDRGVYFTQSPNNNEYGAVGRIQTARRAGRGVRPRSPEWLQVSRNCDNIAESTWEVFRWWRVRPWSARAPHRLTLLLPDAEPADPSSRCSSSPWRRWSSPAQHGRPPIIERRGGTSMAGRGEASSWSPTPRRRSSSSTEFLVGATQPLV